MREKNRDALSRKLEIEQQEAFMTLEQEQQVKTRTAEQNAKIAAFEAERRREAEQTRILAERQIQETEIDREQAVRSRRLRPNVKFALKRSNSSRSPKSLTRRNRSLLPPNRNNSPRQKRVLTLHSQKQ